MMIRQGRRNELSAVVVGMLICVACTGCSTLGLSLYPAGATLTSETKDVLESSRIPSAIPRENAQTVLPPHSLQPGDAVLIEPLDLERDLRLPADQTVLADGTLDLGPYGRVIVAGRDLEEAESIIEQQIRYQVQLQEEKCGTPAASDDVANASEVSPDCDRIAVNVRLLEPVHRYYVLGEVNAPGSYPLAGYETVLDAIVAAGGLTSSANPCGILLSRPSDPCDCRVTLPVCYREIVQLGNTASNYQLRPGDRVFVASRSCLDELLFWRASRPCSRCAGCNRACRNPPMSTTNPIAIAQDTMIPPGSSGYSDTLSDALVPDTSATPALESGSQPSGPRQLRSRDELGDYFNPQSRPLPSPGEPANEDADGELQFRPR